MDCRALGFVLAVGLAAAPLHAQPVEHSLTDGRQLADSCRSSASTLRAMCLGYLAAIADDVRRSGRQDETAACLPAFVDLDVYRTAVIGFARTRSGAGPRPSFDLVQEALASTWPCR